MEKYCDKKYFSHFGSGKELNLITTQTLRHLLLCSPSLSRSRVLYDTDITFSKHSAVNGLGIRHCTQKTG